MLFQCLRWYYRCAIYHLLCSNVCAGISDALLITPAPGIEQWDGGFSLFAAFARDALDALYVSLWQMVSFFLFSMASNQLFVG